MIRIGCSKWFSVSALIETVWWFLYFFSYCSFVSSLLSTEGYSIRVTFSFRLVIFSNRLLFVSIHELHILPLLQLSDTEVIFSFFLLAISHCTTKLASHILSLPSCSYRKTDAKTFILTQMLPYLFFFELTVENNLSQNPSLYPIQFGQTSFFPLICTLFG